MGYVDQALKAVLDGLPLLGIALFILVVLVVVYVLESRRRQKRRSMATPLSRRERERLYH